MHIVLKGSAVRNYTYILRANLDHSQSVDQEPVRVIAGQESGQTINGLGFRAYYLWSCLFTVPSF